MTIAQTIYRFSFYCDGPDPAWERELAEADDTAAIAEGELLLGGQAVVTKSANMSMTVTRLSAGHAQALGSWVLLDGDTRWTPEA